MFAILNSISPETKLKLWQEKMAIVMKKQFTYIERQHLIALQDHLSLDIYTDSAKNKEFNEYAERWWKEAHTLLKWDDKKIFLLTNTLYTEAEFPLHDVLRESGDITLEPGDHITPPYKDPDCTCRYSLSCSQGSCIDGTCGYQPANCGVFGGSRCTGRCQ